eukprot:tig00021517_g21998.t1
MHQVGTRPNVLSGPVDLCVQLSCAGNSILAEGVSTAHGFLAEIDELCAVCGPAGAAAGSPAAAAHAQRGRGLSAQELAARLSKLASDLDSIVSYLTLSLSTVHLVRSAAAAAPVSPARLVRAARLLRAADDEVASGAADEAEVLSVPVKVYQLTQVSVARKRAHADYSLQELWPRGRARLVQRRAPAGVLVELRLEQSLEDGRYHEEGEKEGRLAVPARALVALEGTTRDAMRVGAGDATPLLMIAVDAGELHGEPRTSASAAGAPARPPERWYGLEVYSGGRAAAAGGRCSRSEGSGDDDDREEDEDEEEEEDEKAAAAAPAPQPSPGALGELEYALRVAALEAREGRALEEIPDETGRGVLLAFALGSRQRVAGKVAPAPAEPATPAPWGSPLGAPSNSDAGAVSRLADRLGAASLASSSPAPRTPARPYL